MPDNSLNWALPTSSSRTITRGQQKALCAGFIISLHHSQAKLCRVVEGEAFDVAVDIRLGSPHFGKWTSVLLSAEKQNQIYIPDGIRTWFSWHLPITCNFSISAAISIISDDEHGLAWNDPVLDISMGSCESARLREGCQIAETWPIFPTNFLPRYSAK